MLVRALFNAGKSGTKMNDVEKKKPRRAPRSSSRMPEDSLFYERLVPILLVLLGIIMVILILLAIGILLGIVPFN
jgi:hypothetical protein